jgi:hypothetical protein
MEKVTDSMAYAGGAEWRSLKAVWSRCHSRKGVELESVSSTSIMRPMYKCFGLLLTVSLALFFGLFFGLNYPGNLHSASWSD